MATCNRTSCDNPAEYEHLHLKKMYCHFCAVRINRAARDNGHDPLFDFVKTSVKAHIDENANRWIINPDHDLPEDHKVSDAWSPAAFDEMHKLAGVMTLRGEVLKLLDCPDLNHDSLCTDTAECMANIYKLLEV